MSNYKGYYKNVVSQDIITKLRFLLVNAGYYLRDEDGKLYADLKMGWETPWHHVKHANYLDCNNWHTIMFDLGGKKWVPSPCQNCFKVVVRPKDLRGLFALLELQKKMDVPSKCGIEVRPTVHGNYGGYFYNWGLEMGLQRYKDVREAIDNTEHLGPGTKVLLKRACTEYELELGDSAKWEIKPEQMEWENLINEWVVRDVVYRKQADHSLAYVHRKWIEHAYSIGDPTYADFTDGEPLHKPYVTYQHLYDEVINGKHDKKKPGNSSRKKGTGGSPEAPGKTAGVSKKTVKNKKAAKKK